nr:hypothetical protein [Paenibacillus farraposensis]
MVKNVRVGQGCPAYELALPRAKERLEQKRKQTGFPCLFTALHNYTAITATALNADYRVLSQSGWGVLTSWGNNPHGNIPAYYEQVGGMLTGKRDEALGALSDHDFTSWRPDVVVVNLGTNDGGAFYSPAWTDPTSGKVYKQRLGCRQSTGQ